jgi:hypothetical protein
VRKLHGRFIVQMRHKLISVCFYLIALIFKFLFIHPNSAKKFWKKYICVWYHLAPVMLASLVSE